jgi:hypothetical protein
MVVDPGWVLQSVAVVGACPHHSAERPAGIDMTELERAIADHRRQQVLRDGEVLHPHRAYLLTARHLHGDASYKKLPPPLRARVLPLHDSFVKQRPEVKPILDAIQATRT